MIHMMTRNETSVDAQTARNRWRRAGILLALVLLLIAVNMLYVPATTWRGVMTAPAGDVLYAAGFDGFLDEWQQYSGRESALIADGVLRMSVDSSSVIYSAAVPYFADFDLSVTARAVDGEDNNAFGLIFRLQEPDTRCTMPLQILCDLSDSSALLGAPLKLLFRQPQQITGYMMFLISSDGYYSVWRGSADGQGKLSDWIYRDDLIAMGQNVENQLRVVAIGSEYRFFINGTQVELCIPDQAGAVSTYYNALQQCLDGTMQPALLDDSFTTGQIALVLDAVNSAPGFTIEFDNLVILSPSAVLQERTDA
jgi:hypothetical protein